MAVIVQKYGGSSVANLERLRGVARRIVATRQRGVDVVVVVSAMGETTDDLLRLANEVHDAPSRRELDMLLSVGERISMVLLSLAVQRLGCDAISFTGSQSGIITDESHANARIVEVRPHRIREALAQGKVVIVAGYQGVSRHREVTTLGRGGSDTSAVALAAALDAERCEILSDVDGVLTCDPRVVSEARPLQHLDYGQMQELSTWGAKVLNAEAVEFARAAGITIHAGAALRETPGTRIGGDSGEVGGDAGDRAAEQGLAAGVALLEEIAIVEHDGSAEELLRRFASSGVTPQSVRTEGTTASAVIPLANLHNEEVLRRDERLRWRDDLVAVTAVGRRLIAAGALDLSLAALARQGVPVLDLEATDLRLTLYVSKDHGARATRVLHACLVEGTAVRR